MNRRHTVFDEIRRIQDQMDSLFQSFWSEDPFMRPDKLLGGPNERAVSNYKEAPADIWETENAVKAAFEIPGVDKKDIRVQVTGQGLEVKAETKSEVKDEQKGMYRMERRYAGFYRSFALPADVDADKATAEYKDGVLRISIPKKTVEEKKGKYLNVK